MSDEDKLTVKKVHNVLEEKYGMGDVGLVIAKLEDANTTLKARVKELEAIEEQCKCDNCGQGRSPLNNVMGDMVCDSCILTEYKEGYEKQKSKLTAKDTAIDEVIKLIGMQLKNNGGSSFLDVALAKLNELKKGD